MEHVEDPKSSISSIKSPETVNWALGREQKRAGFPANGSTPKSQLKKSIPIAGFRPPPRSWIEYPNSPPKKKWQRFSSVKWSNWSHVFWGKEKFVVVKKMIKCIRVIIWIYSLFISKAKHFSVLKLSLLLLHLQFLCQWSLNIHFLLSFSSVLSYFVMGTSLCNEAALKLKLSCTLKLSNQ